MKKNIYEPVTLGVLGNGLFMSCINTIEFKSEIIEKYDKLNFLRKKIDVDKYNAVFVYLVEKNGNGQSAVFFIDLFSFVIEKDKLDVLKKFRLLKENIERKVKKLNNIFDRNYKIYYIHECELKHAATEFLRLASPAAIQKNIYSVDGCQIKKIVYLNEKKDKRHGKGI